jgi:hypothetical protein
LYGALRKVDQKNLERFEIRFLRRMENISLTDLVRNEEVLQSVKEEKNILQEYKEGRLTGLVTSYVGTDFKTHY